MVESERNADGDIRFILRSNGSMSRRQILTFLGVAGLVMASIAIGFSMLGLWLVLPFSGAEWLLLAWAFNLSFREATLREVVTITEASVVLEKGYDGPEQTYRFQRAWMSVDWTKPPFKGHPSRLAFRSHGRQVEVGCFLVESEREELVRELRQILVG